jgi:hypothetical protein
MSIGYRKWGGWRIMVGFCSAKYGCINTKELKGNEDLSTFSSEK